MRRVELPIMKYSGNVYESSCWDLTLEASRDRDRMSPGAGKRARVFTHVRLYAQTQFVNSGINHFNYWNTSQSNNRGSGSITRGFKSPSGGFLRVGPVGELLTVPKWEDEEVSVSFLWESHRTRNCSNRWCCFIIIDHLIIWCPSFIWIRLFSYESLSTYYFCWLDRSDINKYALLLYCIYLFYLTS